MQSQLGEIYFRFSNGAQSWAHLTKRHLALSFRRNPVRRGVLHEPFTVRNL